MGETEREEFKNWFIDAIKRIKAVCEIKPFNEKAYMLRVEKEFFISNNAFDKAIEVFEPVLTEQKNFANEPECTKYSFIFEEIEVFTLVRE